MSTFADQRTLAYNLHGRPFCRRINFSEANATRVAAAAMKLYEESGDTPFRPERLAAAFYVLNHGVAAIRERRSSREILPEAEYGIVREYVDNGALMAARLLFYVLVISTREARHVKNGTQVAEKIKAAGLPEAVAKFVLSVPDEASIAMKHFAAGVKPGMTIGDVATALVLAFRFGKFGSASFGGFKWEVVADAARRLVYGELSGETFLDVGWALAHNGGPIFNKGMYFAQQDTGELYRVLDCQRGGQVPAYILSAYSPGDVLHATARRVVETLGLKTEVDWSAVLAAKPMGDKDFYISKAAQKKIEAAKIAEGAAPGSHVTFFPGKPIAKVQSGRAA